MSLHYLLDGYNVLKKIPAFRDLPLEDGRRGLVKWIDAARPQGSLRNEVTVVFDGHPDHAGGLPGLQMEGVRVIFSQGCSADDTIKRMVDEDRDISNCVVVSDDKDVYLYARSLGARIMKVADFTVKSRQDHGTPPSGTKNISQSRQEKINQEFYKIWLKEDQ